MPRHCFYIIIFIIYREANPNDKYYQIPSKSQFPNPKKEKIKQKEGEVGSIGIYLDLGFQGKVGEME